MTRKTMTRAAKQRAKPVKSAAVQPYDVSFEAILHLARFAKAGVDVNRVLIEMVDSNIDGLMRMREFLVAMGVIPRPADAVLPSRTQIANANANKAFPRQGFNPFR